MYFDSIPLIELFRLCNYIHFMSGGREPGNSGIVMCSQLGAEGMHMCMCMHFGLTVCVCVGGGKA